MKRLVSILALVLCGTVVPLTNTFLLTAFSLGRSQAKQNTSTMNIARQEHIRDKRGRIAELIDYDSQGNILHRQFYNYNPPKGTFETTDYYANGTTARTLHKGSAESLPWRVYHYRGQSELQMIKEYEPVRARTGKIRAWRELILFSEGRWYKPPLVQRTLR